MNIEILNLFYKARYRVPQKQSSLFPFIYSNTLLQIDETQQFIGFMIMNNKNSSKYSRLPTLSQLLLLISLVIVSNTAECHGNPGQKQVNLLPIWKGEPKHIRSHPNGNLYSIGDSQSKMKLLHVYGNMYQMGLAHGSLLRQQLSQMMPRVWQYLQGQFTDVLPKKIPKFLQLPVTNAFLETALDMTYQITKPFTNKKYYEEMRGIAEGSGVSFKHLRRIHMIGELTKGTCSMFGAWGKATKDGKLIQLRALDWDIDGPFKDYPLAVVYHPSSNKYGQPWLNLGFCGWVGVVSGVNSHRLAVSEIGVYFNDQTFGKESRFGNPFTFVLRDILQWDKTLDQSINRLKTTKRTCNLIMGVGDGKSNLFRGFQYSHSVLNVVNDTHLLPVNKTWHPQLQNVIYYGMDWLCPPFHTRLYQMLNEYHTEITVENTISHILPGLRSGNLQAVIYDLANEKVYVSYGTKVDKKVVNAFERQYIELDLSLMFKQTLKL